MNFIGTSFLQIEKLLHSKNWYYCYFPIFILIYGFSVLGYEQFKVLHNDPFVLLNQQYQYLLGHYGFGWMPPEFSYACTQLVGFCYLGFAIKWFAETREINFSYFIKLLAVSPFFLVLFVWQGKPDPFIIGSFFMICSVHYTKKTISLLAVLIAIFSHPQIALIHCVLIIFLNFKKPSVIFFLNYIAAFTLYFIYLNLLDGDLHGRTDQIIANGKALFRNQFTNPVLSIVLSFGWFWLIIFNIWQKLNSKFWISLIFCFIISMLSMDFTRTFLQIALPLFVILIMEVNRTNILEKITRFVPLTVLLFIQFQKVPGAIISDTAWSWF